MSIFTSGREKRLWLWTLAVLLAIFSTLGPAVTLASFLREQNFLQIFIAILVILFVGVLLFQWARQRPGLAEVFTALGVGFVYWLVWIRVQIPEERTHLIEYSLVALLVHAALKERIRNGVQIRQPAVTALVLTALLGWVDEGIQAFLPRRFYDWFDVLFNFLAATMAIGASVALTWVRAKTSRRPGKSD